MPDSKQPSVVTITDENYVIPVFILVASLKFHRVDCRINVLAVNLSAEQRKLFEQFPDTEVVEADPGNQGNAATRKAEAILSARDHDCDFITLLDGDCIATGDISEYLSPDQSGIMSRPKTPKEDGAVFAEYYASGEPRGGIPEQILKIWQEDVGERAEPVIKNTVIGGNLSVHRDHLGFVEKWARQMKKVLPGFDTGEAYDYDSLGYFQLDESVLNSLLAFAEDSPPQLEYLFNKNPKAYVAHLGPGRPRFWQLWPYARLRYYPQIKQILRWAKNQGWQLPELTWTLKPAFTPLVYASAWGYQFVKTIYTRLFRPLVRAVVHGTGVAKRR